MLTLSATAPNPAIVYRPTPGVIRLLTAHDEVSRAVDRALRRYGPPDTLLAWEEVTEAVAEVLHAYQPDEILAAAAKGETWPFDLGLVVDDGEKGS